MQFPLSSLLASILVNLSDVLRVGPDSCRAGAGHAPDSTVPLVRIATSLAPKKISITLYRHKTSIYTTDSSLLTLHLEILV